MVSWVAEQMNSTSLWIYVLSLNALVFYKLGKFPEVGAFTVALLTVDCPGSNWIKAHFELWMH